MIRNSKETGNDVFAFGAEKGDESHVAVLSLCWDNPDPIFKLLSISADGDKIEFGLEYINGLEDGCQAVQLYELASEAGDARATSNLST